MVHLTRLILEFVSFRHGFEPDLAGGKNRYMNAIARISQKQPLPFVFRAEGTRRKLFTVTFQEHAPTGAPPRAPAPNMSQAGPAYPTVGALGFEEPFGDPADSGEYPFRFQLMLDVHPRQFADMWRQAARGITPSELFVCAIGGERAHDQHTAYNAWNPANPGERLHIATYQIDYWQPAGAAQRSLSDDLVSQIP